MGRPIRLRSATAADEPILRRIHAEAHCAHLLVLPQPARDSLIALQFQAQQAQYRTDHPVSTDELIHIGDEIVGRCWTADGADDLRLLDLAVLPSHHRQGIGAAVLAVLLDRAADRPLTLSVWADNHPARALYRRAGLIETAMSDSGYLAMSSVVETRQ